MIVPLQQPSAAREPFNSQGIIANSSLSRLHSHAAEHLVLVPATEAPYVCRKSSIEKCTMLADILLMFCTETLVPFGALEHPNLCKKVCCDSGSVRAFSNTAVSIQSGSHTHVNQPASGRRGNLMVWLGKHALKVCSKSPPESSSPKVIMISRMQKASGVGGWEIKKSNL